MSVLEPFPGVPPTANHVLKVIDASQQGVKKILVENYFSDSVARKVASQIPHITVESIPVAVAGSSHVKNIDDLYEELVSKIEAK